MAQAIVDHQVEFLNKGPESIEPLKMQQIADKVGVHVTTVSRAVDDKWVQTPRGIFPLKRFFVGGTVSADGEEVAWDAVRVKLQEIVDHENKQHPFSDDDLVKELAKHGLTVARRTVTKYRKAMDIPSSRQRRDWTLTKPDVAPPDAEAKGAAAHDDDGEEEHDKTAHGEPDVALPPPQHELDSANASSGASGSNLVAATAERAAGHLEPAAPNGHWANGSNHGLRTASPDVTSPGAASPGEVSPDSAAPVVHSRAPHG